MEKQIQSALMNNPLTTEIVNGSDHVGNLSLMEEALTLAAAFKKDQKTRIIVKKNRYEAQQLFSRLAMLDESVNLFVMEESLRVQAIASSIEDSVSQLGSLIHLSKNEPQILIVNAAAYLRFLPDVQFFKNSAIDLHVGMEITMNDLRAKLNRIGYTKVNYVEHPSSFSSRGGIIDIYSVEYNNPIRVEFFDTEIDSIRFFNPETQRTISSTDSVHISPATDILFSDEQIEELDEKIHKRLDKELSSIKNEEDQEILKDAIFQDLENLKNYAPEPALYKYFGYLKPGKLTDYIDGEVIFSTVEEVESYVKQLVIDNTAFIQEQVQDHRSLGRYTLFHDLFDMEKENKPIYFHDFISFEHPVHSEIFPPDPHSSNWMAWVAEEGKQDDVYFALEKEDLDLMKDRMDTTGFKFIDADFYEGFKMPGFKVYTRKEIFHHTNRRTPYQKTFKESQVLNDILELEKGDYVVHGQYGIGQYLGIVTREQNGKSADYLHIVYRDGDDLYVPLNKYQMIRKFISKEGVGTKLSKLGSGQWEKTKKRVSEKVEEIAGRLVDLYAVRNQNIGYAYPPDGALEREFDEAFEYESTPDQLRATAEIKAEMEKPKPMDHLLCGDVGFGKTEVAMRCAFKAICNGKQVAFLCPTTILSMQHYETLKKRFDAIGAKVAMVNRFVSAKEMKEIEKGLEDGTIDIVVGTHRLFNQKIKYKDLGLLIIDEEQRFGVEHKEKIKEMKNNIDVLSLSATPIPRTMQMSLIGVRTISQLNTPPAQRHPIQTYVMEKRGKTIEEIIQRELARDGQVFYMHNRVQDIFRVAKDLESKFPDAGVGVAHGRMSREEIEEIMYDFSQGKFKILVCTTIIETGLDIANANTIIIENADRFGLAQLYQIRGRVGRRDKLAYCYLIVTPDKTLSEAASKRLKSIKEFTQLGSGYKIAMRDLTIRGAGDMLGPKQAGFIDQVGLDMYLEMLSEAIARKHGKIPEEKKETKISGVSVDDGYIPAPFTSSDGDKLSLYQEMRAISSYKELDEYEKRIQDLFGKIPKEVIKLFDQKRLDLFANEPGVASIKENGKQIVISMEEQWSRNVDGLRLFQDMGRVSRMVKMTYKNKQIQIFFDKKKNYLQLIQKISQIVLDPTYMKTR
ncbi:transcription-repair coupling factor [Ileibacterium valens]|uniref:transcription-repair coupling factor n=1 Tax=Ileibacterium valens TaxID=1862668 RepID=UPI0024BBB239|nr:transcription-repair coupling factor [Ileibacterium valens]